MPVDNPGNIVATDDDAHDLAYEESTPGDWGTKPRTVGKALDSLAAGGGLTSPVGIPDGGTGQTAAQAAIDALTQVSLATIGHVLTKSAGGNAVYEAAAGGNSGEFHAVFFSQSQGHAIV